MSFVKKYEQPRCRMSLFTVSRDPAGLAKPVRLRCLRILVDQSAQDRSPVNAGVQVNNVRCRNRWLLEQTALCTYLSAVLLLGLVLNAAFGWSWADPIAALVIAGVAAREGAEAWRGDHCDDCAPIAADRPGDRSCGPDCKDRC
jgi:hypothetical protein